MSNESGPRRGRRPAPEGERKDKVIQTRVPRELEDSLRDAADRQRVTVSHLIRNVLEDSVNLVDNIVAESTSLVSNVTRDARRLAASARGEETRPEPERLVPAREGGERARVLMEAVEAWQEVILNRAGYCIHCGVYVARGEKAFRGVTDDSTMPSLWICPDCVGDL